MLNKSILRSVFVLLTTIAAPVMAQSTENRIGFIGTTQAPVEVIEVIGLSCSTCREHHAVGSTFDKFKNAYIDRNIARWDVRDYYLSRSDLWMGMIVRCGDPNGKLQRMSALLDRQDELRGLGDANAIAVWLKGVGMDMGLTGVEIDACFSDADLAQGMVAAQTAFMEKYGLDGREDFGLPFFIVNGTPVWNVGGRIDYGRVNDSIYSEYKRSAR